MAQSKVIIETKNVTKNYGSGTSLNRVLRGVDMKVMSGEFVIVFGPSGSGKSTLLNILSGLEQPTSGSIVIDNQDIATLKSDERALFHREKVGMVFQAYNLIPSLTVMQNITLPLIFSKIPKSEREDRAIVLLKKFKLEQLAKRLPVEASGGQMQRVGIIRALITEPPIIIADEPTGNLDSVATKTVMEEFAALNDEFHNTLLVVTHDPSLAKYADRIIHVLDGKVIKENPRKKVRAEVEELSPYELLVKSETNAVRKHMLDLLALMLSQPQLMSFSSDEIKGIMNLMIQRYKNRIDSKEMKKALDQPVHDGGIGLYEPTADHITEHFDQILTLLKL